MVTGSRRGENVPTGLEPARRRFSERARNQKSLHPPTDPCCSGLEPDGAWSRRPSACVWRSGYWFESEEQIKQEPPRRSLEGSCFMRSPDWTRTSNPSINSRMLCQLSYGGLFCFRCWFPLQRVITIPGLFGLRNLKCREVHHSLGCVVRAPADRRYSPALPGNLQNTGHSADCRGAAAEPCLAALCVELSAVHFQFEELTLYRFELFVIGVGAELL